MDHLMTDEQKEWYVYNVWFRRLVDSFIPILFDMMLCYAKQKEEKHQKDYVETMRGVNRSFRWKIL